MTSLEQGIHTVWRAWSIVFSGNQTKQRKEVECLSGNDAVSKFTLDVASLLFEGELVVCFGARLVSQVHVFFFVGVLRACEPSRARLCSTMEVKVKLWLSGHEQHSHTQVANETFWARAFRLQGLSTTKGADTVLNYRGHYKLWTVHQRVCYVKAQKGATPAEQGSQLVSGRRNENLRPS